MKYLFEALPMLSSTRFWAIVVMALAVWLHAEELIPFELMTFLEMIFGGHVGLRTIDRTAELLSKRR